MSQHGFTAVTYDPWRRNIAAKNKRSDNTLYIRDIERVKRRVAEASPFRVFGRSISLAYAPSRPQHSTSGSTSGWRT